MAINQFNSQGIVASESDSIRELDKLFVGNTEKTVSKSAAYADSQYDPYNPDDLYQKTGDYSIYNDMLHDDQVSSVLQLKNDLIIGSGGDIISSDDNINDFIYKAIYEEPDCPFDDLLEEWAGTAYLYGFSISEKLFKQNNMGVVLKNIKTRHPVTWLIQRDKHGNVTNYWQQGVNNEMSEIPGKKLLHFINKPQFQKPFGQSDLRPAHDAWFVKKHLIRYYARFLEKAAGPIPHAKYDPNSPKGTAQDLQDAIEKFQASTAITTPDTVSIEWLKSENNGDAYHKGINLFNMFIGRSVLVPDLVGLQGSDSGGGSHALAKEQMDVFFRHLSKKRKSIEQVINNHIIRPIVINNFGFIEDMPTFQLKPLQNETAIELAEVWLKAVNGGAYKPNDEEVNHFRRSVKYPEGDVEFKEEAPMFPGARFDEPKDSPEADNELEKELEDDLEKMAEKPKEFALKPYNDLPGEYKNKVDFKAMGRALDSTFDKIKSGSAPVVKRQIDDFIKQINKKKIISGQKIERINELKIKFIPQLRSAFKFALKELYNQGFAQARSEIFKTQSNFALPLSDAKFLEAVDAELFAYMGDYAHALNKGARIRLIAALKDGLPWSTIEQILKGEMSAIGARSIDTFARTKATEVFNKARMAFFESNEAVQGYQFSAILDGRTTEICMGLHGKRFKKENAPVPPLHFNCRSVLIPITVFEEFKEDKTRNNPGDLDFTTVNDPEGKNAPKVKISGPKNIQDFIDQRKGAGFPAK